MTDTKKKVAFAWDDKNTVVVVDAYNAELNRELDPANKDDVNQHNSKKFLADLADKVGAKSGASVRCKLSSEKVYVKSDTATASGKVKDVKPTKVSTVYNLEKILGLEKESLDTLDKANASALETLTGAIVALGTDEAITEAYEALQDRLEAETESR